MIRTQIFILLLSIMVTFPHDMLSQHVWELNKNQNGISVYTKTEKGSEFKAFKAVAFYHASIAELMEILINADRYSEWYGYTKTAELLQRENNIQYNYVETMFPWPYNNRDMVYRMTIDTADSTSVEISLTGIPDFIPAKKGIVRMKKAEGYILLKSLGSTTKVVYMLHTEPGQNIPSWLANNSISALPFKTMLGLREMLDKENSRSE